jgi:hypothetical protein
MDTTDHHNSNDSHIANENQTTNENLSINETDNVGDNESPHGASGRPVTNRAHPRIYTIVAGLCAWFVLAAWSFTANGLVNYLLVIISGFIFAAIVLMLILFSIKRPDTREGAAGEPSLRAWSSFDYDTWTGRLPGAQAATEIVLPIAAAAVGMTLIGLIFLFAGHGVA